MPVIPCAPTPPVFGIVQFDPAAFIVQYPEFTGISAGSLNQNFAIAELLLDNSCRSRVIDANKRETLLSILVAHVTLIQNGSNDGAGNVQPPLGIVGRINTATEGQVSVGSEFDAPANATQSYFLQTKYGALYWTLIARYRTFVYAAAPACDYGLPYGPGPGFGGPGECGC